MMTWQNIKPVGNLMLLALATAAPLSGMAESSGSQYSYSDEWSIVSAPPPSGPFRSIHLDPRIPGQGIAPPTVTTSFDDLPGLQAPAADDALQQAGSDAGMTSLPPPAAGLVDHDPSLADADVAPLPSPGLLPPPPGPAELPAPPVAGDVDLVDIETGRRLPMSLTDEAIDRYVERRDAWLESIATQVAGLGAAYTLVGADQDLREVILGSLPGSGVLA